MPSKLPGAKITDLVTTVDSQVFASPAGPMAWATIDICYLSEGLEPKVTIKVPVPVTAAQSDAQQREEALRRARHLIDHACVAVGSQPSLVQDAAEVLEGLAEELGMLAPTAAPKHVRRA